MIATNIDMDLLRTFTTGTSLGSFAKAADRLGRSPSAISLQLRRLEQQVGQTLLQKQGRGLGLTEAGELLLGYAHRILDLNDEATTRLRDLGAVEGWVRVGLPQDFAETWFPDLLGRFARAHPQVRVEARVDRGSVLIDAVERGALDLALTWGDTRSAHCETVSEHRAVWIGPQGFVRDATQPLPIVAFDAPCSFRAGATAALEAEGIAWRLSFASPSLSGLWAAVTAGLGITVRTREGIPGHLRVLDSRRSSLPALDPIGLVLHRAESGPQAPIARLHGLIMDAVSRSTDRPGSRRHRPV